jgi:hypothetical protein
MTHRAPLALLTLALLLLRGGPVEAENPRVSLKVAGATAVEAAAQLSQAAGVPLQVYGNGPEERAGFDWTNVSFGRALRQLCEKFNLQPTRQAGGYALQPAPAPGPPPKRVGLVEKDGARLYVRGISVTDKRSVNFGGEAGGWDDSQMALQLFAEMGDRDAEAVEGVRNVRARDDLGNLLTSDPSRESYSGAYGAQYPDEWSGSVALPPPNPRAKKLQTVEGDLMVYRSVKALRVEIPLPPREKSVRKEAGDWLIVVSQYEASHQEPDDDDAGLPNLGARVGATGPAMRVRTYYPLKARVSWRGGVGWHPNLVSASGRVYQPILSGGIGAGNGQLTLSDSRLVFPQLDSPPAKLVWNLIQKDDPARLFSFRMTDVPLPGPPGAANPAPAPRPASPAAPGGALNPDHPFYGLGGGVLVNRVRIGERAAGEGTLQLGLALKRGAEWGPVRWMETEVDADGLARIENVKPGSYRLARVYRPSHPPLGWTPSAGRWQGGDAPITVLAGKEAVIPPLQWMPRKQ